MCPEEGLDLAKIEYYSDCAGFVGYLFWNSWYIVQMDVYNRSEHLNLLKHSYIAQYSSAIASWRFRSDLMQYELFVELLRRRYAKRPKTGNLLSLEYIWSVFAQLLVVSHLHLYENKTAALIRCTVVTSSERYNEPIEMLLSCISTDIQTGRS